MGSVQHTFERIALVSFCTAHFSLKHSYLPWKRKKRMRQRARKNVTKMEIGKLFSGSVLPLFSYAGRIYFVL